MTNKRIVEAKVRSRTEVDARMEGLDASSRVIAGTQLRRLMEIQPIWRESRRLLCFAPMPGEIDIWPLVLDALKQGKEVALPRYERQTKTYNVCRIENPDRDLVGGYFGIREPAAHCVKPESNLLDLILVPGVGFDQTGRRLGRGKGFYDRLLVAWRGVTCGVCYDEQILKDIPVEPHDVLMDCILTPTRFFQPDRS